MAMCDTYLRSTSYIAIELNVLHLKSYEIQSNRGAQAIYSAVDCISWNHLIAYYSFAGLWGVKRVKVFISAYKRCRLFSLAFVVVVFAFLKQARHSEFQSYGGA